MPTLASGAQPPERPWGIQRAARHLNLRLMGQRTNLYARYHCFPLAERLLAPPGGAPA